MIKFFCAFTMESAMIKKMNKIFNVTNAYKPPLMLGLFGRFLLYIVSKK